MTHEIFKDPIWSKPSASKPSASTKSIPSKSKITRLSFSFEEDEPVPQKAKLAIEEKKRT